MMFVQIPHRLKKKIRIFIVLLKKLREKTYNPRGIKNSKSFLTRQNKSWAIIPNTLNVVVLKRGIKKYFLI